MTARRALKGPHIEPLDRLSTHGLLWFAWSRFHPETTVYDGSDGRGLNKQRLNGCVTKPGYPTARSGRPERRRAQP